MKRIEAGAVSLLLGVVLSGCVAKGASESGRARIDPSQPGLVRLQELLARPGALKPPQYVLNYLNDDEALPEDAPQLAYDIRRVDDTLAVDLRLALASSEHSLTTPASGFLASASSQ